MFQRLRAVGDTQQGKSFGRKPAARKSDMAEWFRDAL